MLNFLLFSEIFCFVDSLVNYNDDNNDYDDHNEKIHKNNNKNYNNYKNDNVNNHIYYNL